MLHLLFVCFASKTIHLEAREPMPLPGKFKGRYRRVCPDGSFLVINETLVFHFDTQGRLIRRFGTKGKGPGEFTFILTGLWDGVRYYLGDLDGSKTITVFDSEGRYEKNIDPAGEITKMGHTGRSFYVFRLTPRPRPSPYQGILEFDTFDALESHTLEPFHPTSQDVQKFLYNNDNHWLVFYGNKLYVADEIAPCAHVYDLDYVLLKTIELELPGFVPSPDRWVSYKGTTKVQRKQWYCSWSRINGFAVNEKGLLVAYEIPNEADPLGTLTALVRLDFGGKPTAPIERVDAEFMGTHAGFYYLFRELDKGRIFPTYQVEVKAW